MLFKAYLWGIAIVAILSWSALAIIVINVDPFVADLRILVAFFVSLFLGLTLAITFMGYLIRVKLSRKEVVFAHLGIAFRQAALISLAGVGILILSSFSVLTWWTAILLVAAVLLLELFSKTN